MPYDFRKNRSEQKQNVGSPVIHGTSNTENIADKLWSRIERKLEKWAENFSLQLDAKLLALEDRFKSQVSETKKAIEHQMQKIDQDIKRLELITDEIDRERVSSDAVIFGIPESPDENLENIFHSICSTVNIQPPRFNKVFRVKSRPRSSTHERTSDASIILKLADKREKQSLMRAVARYRKNKKCSLKLSDVGFSSSNTFFINDSLTKKNYQLLREALKLKRRSRLSSVYTYNGQIYIRHSSGPSVLINNVYQNGYAANQI